MSIRMQRVACAAGALAFGCCGFVIPAIAQNSNTGKTVSYPVVEPLPSREKLQLNAALAKLGRNPRDLDALIDAGDAALGMGDVDAALGFFRRADQVSTNNPRVKAGLARASVRKDDPVGAIALFDEAERDGAKASALAADRGLAFDLVGDNATAQRYYRMALADGENDEITRRLALSLAISGDRRGMEKALLPLLRKQDKAAWRSRAFALAILGKTKEAVRIAETILPATLAEGVAPYLRYMPRLTAAQQAAAANLGDFPRASEIGRDDPRIAQYIAARRQGTEIASADAGQGEVVGDGSRSGRDRRSSRSSEQRSETPPNFASREAQEPSSAREVRSAPPEPQPARQASASAEPELAATNPPVSSAEPAAEPGTPAGAEVAMSAKPATAAPGFNIAGTSNDQASAAPPPTREAFENRPTLAEAFDNLGKPKITLAPAAGAVDIRHITPAQPKPPVKEVKPSKPPPPSHPSRIWVQIGVGRNKDAIAFDWRKLNREHAVLFKGRKPYTSVMGRTNRMLTGPFESEKAADEFIEKLHRADIDGPYVWISPAGQVVDVLSER